MRNLESIGEVAARDPRSADLKFMYHMPQSEDKPIAKQEVKLDPNGDDEYVVKFKALIAGKAGASVDTDFAEDSAGHHPPPSFHSSSGGNESPGSDSLVGRLPEVAQHPRLVHAPTQGSHLRGGDLRHKPFGEVIHNIQCLRCRGWGHRAVDSECPLRDKEASEASRLKREDPLTLITQGLGMGGSTIQLKDRRENQSLIPYDGTKHRLNIFASVSQRRRRNWSSSLRYRQKRKENYSRKYK